MVTTPTKNDLNWDVSLNAALNDLQSQISVNTSGLATATTNIGALQNANTGQPSPASYGLLGWTHDPASVNTGQLLTNGTLYLNRVNIGTSATATKLFWGINTAGVTPTAGQNFVGLYDASGNRVASVGTDARITTTGLFQETISTNVTPGFYWVGILVNAATAPQVYRSQSLNATLVNTNLSATTLRWATNGTGLTALPATITPSSNSFSQMTLYAALAV